MPKKLRHRKEEINLSRNMVQIFHFLKNFLIFYYCCECHQWIKGIAEVLKTWMQLKGQNAPVSFSSFLQWLSESEYRAQVSQSYWITWSRIISYLKLLSQGHGRFHLESTIHKSFLTPLWILSDKVIIPYCTHKTWEMGTWFLDLLKM